MSKKYKTYYYLIGEDTYHFELSCPDNHYPQVGWVSSYAEPMKEQCGICQKFGHESKKSK